MSTGLSPSMAPHIQRCSTRSPFCNLPGVPYHSEDISLDPGRTTDTAYHVRLVWAGPRSLATTNGVANCFTFLRLLRCFNSPGWPRRPMYSAADRQGLPGGVSPFGDPRISLLPATRGLSQVCHVLHRLSVPRHPPHALISLAETREPTDAPPIGIGATSHRIVIRFLPTLSHSVSLRHPCIQLSKNPPPGSFAWWSQLVCVRVVAVGTTVHALGFLVEMIGIEPTTSGLQSRRSPN